MTRAAGASLGAALLASACAATAPGPSPAPPAACPPAAAPTVAAAAPPPAPVTFDPGPWLEDLDALVAAMAAHYANLDHAVTARRMDLPALVGRARDRIAASRSRDGAERAVRSLLRAFGDGHLDVDWDPPEARGAPPTAAHEPPCRRLGYEARDPGGVDFTRVPGWTPAVDDDSADVPGGVLRLGGGRALGVLRIGLFVEKTHPGLCEAAAAALHLADGAACDEACADALEVAVADRLTAALERRALALAKAGARVLAVDLTGNGGGDDWVDPAMRTLSPVPVPLTARGAVRGPHWLRSLEETRRELEGDLAAHGDLPGGAIAKALERVRHEIAEVSTPCDKLPLFRGGAAPSCAQLVSIAPVLEYAAPGALSARASATTLFWPSRYRYHEGLQKLPLVVLVDGWTASAAEDFAERMQDLRVATLVGAPTLGSGCGFTNGGIPTVLPRSGGRVRMSDCARFRADGSNAVAGVTPDVVLPLLDRDSPAQRAEKVARGLDAAWGRVASRAPAR